MVASLNDSYPTIFGKEDKEGDSNDKGSDQERGNEGSVEDDEKPTGFLAKWSWLYWIDIASGAQRISWEEMLKKSVVEFLNTIAYVADKNAYEDSERKRKLKMKTF